MPSAPPAGLSHALSAGYIPTYEALLRSKLAFYIPDRNGSERNVMAEVSARKATRLLRSLLLVAPGSKLLLLLGEGDPREAAALATTLCKAHLQHAELAAKAGSREGLAEAARLVTATAHVVRRGLLRERGRAVMSLGDALAAVGVPGAELSDDDPCRSGERSGSMSSSSSSSSQGTGSGGGGGGDSSAGSGDEDASAGKGNNFTRTFAVGCEIKRVLVASFILPRLLPVMTRIGSLCFAGGLGASGEVHSLACTRGQLHKHAALGVSNCAGRSSHGDAMSSWEQFQWIDMGADQVACDWGGEGPSEEGSCGEESRGERRAEEGRGRAAQAGKQEEEEESKELQRMLQEELRWSKVVPHAPCDTAQLLLRTCSNPLCVNMRGDSEAGLELRVPSIPDVDSEEEEGSRDANEEGYQVVYYCSVLCREKHAEQMEAVRRWQLQPRGDCSKCRWCRAARFTWAK